MDPAAAGGGQQQMAALQQSQLHQQIMAQQLLGVQQQAVAAGGLVAGVTDTAAITLDRKQREVYVGNLAIGVVTKQILEEFFNQALSHMMPDPVATPPVVNINMDGQGRFAFVEFRSRELANQALMMDKLVEVYGRHLHVGRPKGYIEPTAPPLPLALVAPTAPSGAGVGAASVGGDKGASQAPTRALLLSNILPAVQLRTQEERSILEEEVREEAAKYGEVEAVAVPIPPVSCQDRGPGRAYILYKTVDDAIKGRKIFHTRTLDDSRIKGWYVQPEEFALAARGEWAQRHFSVAGVPLPGLYTMGPLVSGVSGLTALNPALASLWQSNPGIASAMTAGIDEDEVPFEEGVVKLRGFPPVVTKSHILQFFKGCAELSEQDVKIVHGADGTSLGEAFVMLKGPGAKLRLALARDRSPLPPIKTPAEVLTSFAEDMQRRMLSGCQLL